MENKLPDTPWHMGYTKKEESEPRRHKSRCIYIQDGICKCAREGYFMRKCGGSSHCDHYSEGPYDIEERIERDNIDRAVRSNFGETHTKIMGICYHKGKKYYKVDLFENESVMESILIPYKPYMTRREIDSYIKKYHRKK